MNQKSPLNKKRAMFNKRRQTNADGGSFKGEDPFNKFLYPDRSKDNISNFDELNNSRQPAQKSMISLTSQGSGNQRTPQNRKSIDQFIDPRMHAIQPYKQSPRNSRANKDSLQGLTKQSQASYGKGRGVDSNSMKSSVKGNNKSSMQGKNRRTTDSNIPRSDMFKIDDEFKNNYHAANFKSKPSDLEDPQFTTYQNILKSSTPSAQTTD